jgi:protein arginine kinase
MSGDLTNAIVVTSRVRLARNLAGMKFPHRMNEAQQRQAMDAIVRAAEPMPLTLLYAAQMEQSYLLWLVEEHLVSRDWAGAATGALLLSKDREIAIMVMEEDHLRMQCLLDGLALSQAHRRISAQHKTLEKKLAFAKSDAMGYLTACPSNVGTGLRASALMHLPALVITGNARAAFGELKGQGVEVRGLYGEGSEATGHLFQISNRISLGRDESELIAMMTQHILRIAGLETAAREALLAQHRVDIEDKVNRSYGILRHARKLTRDEAMVHLSDVMLGSSIGLIEGVDANLPNLMCRIQEGHLQYDRQNQLPQDQQRAALVSAAMQPGQH